MDQTSTNSSNKGSSGVASVSEPEYDSLRAEVHTISAQTGDAVTTSTVSVRGAPTVIAPQNAPRALSDDLREFFARPRPIYTYSWANAVTASTYIAPWNLLLSNTSVAEKMKYYSMFRGTLHVLALTSTQPQFAGGLRINYFPWGMYYTSRGNDVGASVAGASYISASASTGTHHICPFFYDQSHLQIGMNGGGLALGEATILGTINILPITPLTRADGTAAGTIDVQFYAWFEDVELSGPTFNTQSRSTRGSEIISGGAISAPASVVARFAGTLADVPVIGPFAKATSIAASAVAAVASIFGFSKPTTLRDQEVNIIRAFGKTSVVQGLDSAEKLSADPKQELPISPEWVGLPATEMNTYLSMAQQEGALGYFTVNTTDAAGAYITYYGVYPCLKNAQIATPTNFYPLPIGWASLPFQYWRGSIIFRFRVFSSPFQRGRLFVFYEPAYGSKPSTAAFSGKTADTLLDTNRFCILDISSETDVDFVVKWNQPFEWGLLAGMQTAPYVGGASYSNASNGAIGVFIDAPLTSPGATSCSVFVTMRAGDDFELAMPTTENLNNYISQALVTRGGVGNTDQAATTCVLADGSDSPNAANVYFGEKVVSMRAMSKRYTPFYVFTAPAGSSTSTALVMHQLLLTGVPPPRQATTGPTACRFQWSFASHWAVAHAAYRGGARFKILHNIPTNIRASFVITRNRPISSASTYNPASMGFTYVGRYVSADAMTATGSPIISALVANGNGTQIVDAHAPGGPEFEIPSLGTQVMYISNWNNGYKVVTPSFYCTVITDGYDTNKMLLTFLVAGAEDYTPVYYIGPPVVTFSAVASPF